MYSKCVTVNSSPLMHCHNGHRSWRIILGFLDNTVTNITNAGNVCSPLTIICCLNDAIPSFVAQYTLQAENNHMHHVKSEHVVITLSCVWI